MCNRNVDEIPCRQKPCLPPRGRSPTDSQDDVNAGLKGRPVLYTGVVWIGIVRRFLIPRTCVTVTQMEETKPPVTTTHPRPTKVAHVQDVDSGIHEPPLRYKQKPPPVPLVTEQIEEATGDPKIPLLRRRRDDEDSSNSALKALVVQVHDVSAAAAAQARELTQDLSTILRDGQETTAEVIETVRSEDGRRFRLAAISASGLVGYLVGLKRGVVTRMVYSATGATAMATICYPEDTKSYNRRGLATVRRWVMLGLSLVHIGPQKPLGSGDLRITNNKNLINDEIINKNLTNDETINTNLINNEETINSNNTEQSETDPFVAENVIANLMQNLGSLGHHLEEIKTKLKESNPKTVPNESTKEKETTAVHPGVSDSASNSSLESLSRLKSHRFENLSSNNDANVMKDLPPSSVPYSPALPAPPKVNSSYSKLNITPLETEEDLTTDNLNETTLVKRERSNGYLQPQVADELTSGVDEEDDDDDTQQDDDYEDFSDKTFIIPTGGLEEKLEDRQGHLKKTGHSKNDEKPLNKKLTVFYKNMPEEQKTSREKGYDDAYSNRGK